MLCEVARTLLKILVTRRIVDKFLVEHWDAQKAED